MDTHHLEWLICLQLQWLVDQVVTQITIEIVWYLAAKLPRSSIHMKDRVYGIGPDRHTLRHLQCRSKWMSLCVFLSIILTMTAPFTNNFASSLIKPNLSVNIWLSTKKYNLVDIEIVGSYHLYLRQHTAQNWLPIEMTDMSSIPNESIFECWYISFVHWQKMVVLWYQELIPNPPFNLGSIWLKWADSERYHPIESPHDPFTIIYPYVIPNWMSEFRGAFLLDANALFYCWMGIKCTRRHQHRMIFGIVFYFSKRNCKI